MIKQQDTIVITNTELAGLELAAIKRPSKDGSLAPRIVRCFIEHIANVYGIDLQIETEDMKNERTQREAKEDRKRTKLNRKLGRKPFRSDADDF